MAPSVDISSPAGSPGAYKPANRPIAPPSNAPAIPRSAVMTKPPGSFPGISSVAMMPTIRPKRTHPRIPNMMTSLITPLRNAQHLTRMDLVGIAEHISVELEELHIARRAPEELFGDAAQGVPGF